MGDIVYCSQCGSTEAYEPNPNLCTTPYCTGRMGDGYVPSRHEATRNMAQPKPRWVQGEFDFDGEGE